MTLTNTGQMTFGGVLVDRWMVSHIQDRRENCDGDAAQGSKGIDCDSPAGSFSSATWNGPNDGVVPDLYFSLNAFKTPANVMYKSNGRYATRRGTMRNVELAETPFSTVGPYKAADRVIFLNAPALDPTMFFDTEMHTGNKVRFSAPLQTNVRIRDSAIVAGSEDFLLPMFVSHEYSAWGAGGLKAMRGLQGAGLAEIGLLPWLKSIGSLFIIYFIFLGGARVIWGIPKPVYQNEAEGGDGSLLVGS